MVWRWATMACSMFKDGKGWEEPRLETASSAPHLLLAGLLSPSLLTPRQQSAAQLPQPCSVGKLEKRRRSGVAPWQGEGGGTAHPQG